MKILSKILSENKTELLDLGLLLEDLQLDNFSYLLRHGTTVSNHFFHHKLSFDQTLFLLKFIELYFHNDGSGKLRFFLLNRIKNELIKSLQNKTPLTNILYDKQIKELMVNTFLEDCWGLIHDLYSYTSEGYGSEDMRKLVSKVVAIFQVSTFLSFNTYALFTKLKSEIKEVLASNKKFSSRFRNEYYSLSNTDRNVELEAII